MNYEEKEEMKDVIREVLLEVFPEQFHECLKCKTVMKLEHYKKGRKNFICPKCNHSFTHFEPDFEDWHNRIKELERTV